MANVLKSSWGKIALSLCAVMWTATGWWILVSGGFTRSYRLSKATTYVDGLPAVLMAMLFFTLATVTAWVILESLKPQKGIYALFALVMIGLPGLYLVLK